MKTNLPVSPAKNSKWKAYAFTLAGLAILLGSLYVWRNINLQQQAGWAQQPVPVTAVEVKPVNLTQTLSALGTLTAVNQVVLMPETTGRITHIDFESGDLVKKNQLLVQLYDQTEQANLQASIATSELADVQLTRTQQLAPLGAESEELLAQRLSEKQRALAMVDLARAQLNLKQIRAPFDGRLGIRQVDLGEYLNAGQTVVSLTDLSNLYVEFSVPQQQLSRLHVGAAVSITVDSYPEQTFTAHITTIEPQINETTRNVLVQASLANPQNLLRPSMYVSVSAHIGTQQNALLIPMTAVITSAQGNSVVVIRGNTPVQKGNAEYVAVTLGKQIDNQVVVNTGLTAGDIVITEGQNRIQPQTPVIVSSLQPAKGV